ncbi:pyridoxine/pyridoxamine 5'-phosphate oxidase [Marivirga lumbricoides]|uniref:Pyridoxine/pyridoxamine 5'-phosphate oxidase n=1 Tax=Marivirga lumbricoides TaxID=1046115 RepID=A0ABQ1LYC5_9BACT|nr:pyridoxine/pyridoxamine 5'-phosphate oxidase [Marivirga lumbricoides]
MKKNIADLREEYTKAKLEVNEVSKDPVDQFMTWFDHAINSDIMEPNAMNLATIYNEKVYSRIVLLKGVEEGAFLFYTNYSSDKGRQIEHNSNVALNFFWPELERQVRIEGKATKVSSEVSDSYFKSRPRGSQIGAWVSPQSQKIEAREVLEKKLSEVELKFAEKEVERPPHWGGYAVKPERIEFWQGRSSRLHDRLSYTKEENGNWTIERLAP